ncbi:MAG: ABC transporter ATP-binding protein [Anaerolineales bacterium]
MSDFIIESVDLTKKYGDFVAVDSLNLRVMPGEVFGLLGPNGAGKTTTILMLLGLTEPTSGKVQVLGFDPTRQPLRIKSQAGYIPDQVGFYDELTAYDNLVYIAKLNGLSWQETSQRIDESLEKVGLTSVANQSVGTFSRGMRQRLGVADVLIKKPKLIIMDEPTQGLDPELARDFLSLIRELSSAGITILLSSHLLPQVQEVCDRVGLFHQGRMVLEGTVADLAQQVLGAVFHVRIQANGSKVSYLDDLRSLSGVVEANFKAPDRYTLVATHDLRSEAANTIFHAGGQLTSLDIESLNLDDIYNTYFEEVNHGPRS